MSLRQGVQGLSSFFALFDDFSKWSVSEVKFWLKKFICIMRTFSLVIKKSQNQLQVRLYLNDDTTLKIQGAIIREYPAILKV